MKHAQLPIDWIGGSPPGKEITDVPPQYTLADLHWRDHRTAGICALLIIIILATRLNDVAYKARKTGAVVPDSVAVTWNELQRLTGHARATVGKGLMLLESWGAIKPSLIGRSTMYRLINVHAAGHYAALPIEFLEKDGDPVSRFRNLPSSQLGLNALKLYIVLLRLRSTQYGTTALSFNGITRWTGIRREDIRKTCAYLHTQQLVEISTTRDPRHSATRDNDHSQRYAIIGITRGYTKQSLDLLRRAQEDEASWTTPGLPDPEPDEVALRPPPQLTRLATSLKTMQAPPPEEDFSALM